MKIRAKTRITSKGQVVIPKAVRERMKWKPGTRLKVEATDDRAVVLRQDDTRDDIEAALDALAGCLAGYDRDPIAELEADHRAEIEADERWVRSHR